MIKKLICKFECKSCDSIIELEREIVIDEFTKKIEIIAPKICVCKRKSGFKLLEVKLV
jgi:hypothetical protein